METRLTDLTLRKLIPQSGSRVEIWDTKVPGFGIRVSASGHKSFVLLYRHKGRQRRMTLGRYPDVSLAAARKMASRALRSAEGGADPQTEKVVSKTGVRFDETVKLFLNTYCAQHTRASTRYCYQQLLKQQFVRRWGARDVREISKSPPRRSAWVN